MIDPVPSRVPVFDSVAWSWRVAPVEVAVVFGVVEIVGVDVQLTSSDNARLAVLDWP